MCGLWIADCGLWTVNYMRALQCPILLVPRSMPWPHPHAEPAPEPEYSGVGTEKKEKQRKGKKNSYYIRRVTDE